MPTPAELSRSGVRLAESMERGKAKPLREAMQKFAKAGEMAGKGAGPDRDSEGDSSNPLSAVGVWLGYPPQKAAGEDRK